MTIWGTGSPRREFLYVDDMAAACVHVMNLPMAVWAQYTRPMLGHINVGHGSDVTIAELAQLIAGVVGYGGRLAFDPEKPDGAPRKFMDSRRLNALGWRAEVELEEGLKLAYEDFWGNGEGGRRGMHPLDKTTSRIGHPMMGPREKWSTK